MKLGKKAKRRGGFTLVELLLVVAILAVLAVLAVPAIANTIRNSRIRTCASNEIMVEQTIWRWYADKMAAGVNLALPAGATTAGVTTGLKIADFDDFVVPSETDTLKSYFIPGGVPKCPFAPLTSTTSGGTTTTSGNDFEISIRVANNILEDVLCVCDRDEVDHDRAADRREAF